MTYKSLAKSLGIETETIVKNAVIGKSKSSPILKDALIMVLIAQKGSMYGINYKEFLKSQKLVEETPMQNTNPLLQEKKRPRSSSDPFHIETLETQNSYPRKSPKLFSGDFPRSRPFEELKCIKNGIEKQEQTPLQLQPQFFSTGTNASLSDSQNHWDAGPLLGSELPSFLQPDITSSCMTFLPEDPDSDSIQGFSFS